ncbi:MAG: DUF3568 family protein [Candidatus Methylomirabilales bacterium]
MKPRREIILLLPFLVASTMGGGGCAAAGLAAGPLVTALQFVGGRTVERTLSADLETTWTATVDTLSRMEVRIQETEQSEETWLLEGDGDAVTVHAELAPVTPRMTKVSLRVEAGGLIADKQTAEEILNQLALSLERPAALAEREPSDEREALANAVTTLQGEILHLKAVIDEKEKEEKRAASHPPPERDGVDEDVFSWGSGILVIPSSYGIPILPGATDASAARVPPPPRRNPHVPVLADAPPQTDSGGQEVLATPLVPVEVLAPVRSLNGRQRVR